jgi:centromeric protein E
MVTFRDNNDTYAYLMKVCDLEHGASNGLPSDSPLILSVQSWKSEFQRKQKQIFELWDTCHISVVHRSQFYHLFRGDPGDAIYVEVELRRLTWIRSQNSSVESKGHIFSREEHVASPGVR